MNNTIKLILLLFIGLWLLCFKNTKSYIKSSIIALTPFIIYCLFSLIYNKKELFSDIPYLRRPKKNNRIVVSLTTLPSRLKNINPVIESILNNTIQPDIIYLNIPKISKREKVKYKLTDLTIKHPKLYINNIDKDYGPVTKLYPTLLKEKDPETIIICIDDDIYYDKNTIRYLVRASELYPESCICKTGWNYINLGFMAFPICFPFLFTKKVSILQCFAGVLYKRKFFKNIKKLEKYMEFKECFTTDDITISKFLQDENIEILQVPLDYGISLLGNQITSRLSDENTFNNQWIKCINCK
jgi:hypothetical protein